MTGEMIKPENAENSEEYWKSRISNFGYRILGDESYLIRPNYPDIFELRDEFKKHKVQCEVEPFDVYQGPYLSCRDRKGHFKVWYAPSEEVTLEGRTSRGRAVTRTEFVSKPEGTFLADTGREQFEFHKNDINGFLRYRREK
jgi:hypothetical protein